MGQRGPRSTRPHSPAPPPPSTAQRPPRNQGSGTALPSNGSPAPSGGAQRSAGLSDRQRQRETVFPSLKHGGVGEKPSLSTAVSWAAQKTARSEEVILHLSSAVLGLHPENCVQLRGPQRKADMGQSTAMSTSPGKKGWKAFGVVQPEEDSGDNL